MKIISKKLYITVIILLAITSILFNKYSFSNNQIIEFSPNNKKPVALGIYDPADNFTEISDILIEHHFVTWRLNNTEELVTALNEIKQAHRFPLITLESWAWEWNNMTKETLFNDIINGKYDQTLKQVFTVFLAAKPQQILFRWGHEMEIVDQYPWSKKDAKSFIQAYHYIHDFADKMEVNNLIWIWSPAGFPNAINYWVGRKYVDYIGLSIYATKEWNQSENQDKIPSFNQLMSAKYWFSKKYEKPLFLAEVGVNGNEAEKSQWLRDAIANLSKFPQVKAWIYFNQIQPHIVPLEIGFPNWELNEEQIKILLESWRKYDSSF